MSQPPTSPRPVIKKLSLAQLNRKVASARARVAQLSAQADEKAACEKSRVVDVGVARANTVSSRMSSKGFGNKCPKDALQLLELVQLNTMQVYEFEGLCMTSFKYHVSTLAQMLLDKKIYQSIRSASLPASQVVRHLFEVAMEIGNESQTKLLQWQTGQQLLQGRASRGAGIVAANADAKALLEKALDVSLKRVKARVEAAERCEREMFAAVSACYA